jgi:hypothetical protein
VNLSRLCRERRADVLADWLSETYGVAVAPEVVEGFFAVVSRFDSECRLHWSDCTWAMWLKHRMDAAGLLPGPGCAAAEITLPTTLHVGFATVHEDDAMLARLRVPETLPRHRPADDEAPVARSRIFTATAIPRSIDAVAARVSGIPVDGGVGRSDQRSLFADAAPA